MRMLGAFRIVSCVIVLNYYVVAGLHTGNASIPLVEFVYYSPQLSSPDVAQAYGAGRPGAATNTHSCGNIRAVPPELRSANNMYPNGLGQFYQKYTEAYGIPILGSSYLPDDALKRACYIARFLLADHYDIRNSYYKMYGRFALMGVNEVTTDIPEHTNLGTWWNTRARGLGATPDRPVSTAAEENALCYSTDSYYNEDILLHEFTHGTHLLGASYVLPNFDSRLVALYNSAKAQGLWANTYAMSTDKEYLAEGTQSYFNSNAYSNPPNGIHNHIDTREKLASYDPGLYALIEELFPCGNPFILRCDKDRQGELNQQLSLDCSGGGGGGGGGGDGGDECDDVDEGCASWASDGWCDRCPAYMTDNCKLSCQLCDDDDDDDDGGGECYDENVYCSSWAATGECDANPGYMMIYCQASCGVC